MEETYVEWLVKGKTSTASVFLKYFLIALAVIFGLASFLFGAFVLLIAVVLGAAAYLVHILSNVEYEYLYLDKELSVDKIFAQSRRKRAATYEIGRMEILAPIKSYHLADYNNRTVKEIDYSEGASEPDDRYVMYYEGNQKIILSPNDALVKAIKNIAPRKVFTD
ncbi:MAG: hypothetical protein IJ608_00650 [Lachnospiraceae bacterium]|nr:hypothetical protein [Lachnospiraceae bacterium]